MKSPGRPHDTAAQPVEVTSSDGVPLRGSYRPGPRSHDAAVAAGPAVVIAHGFTNATRKPSTQAVITGFARHSAVVALDFRGHGGSGGRSTVGRDETLDIDAAVRFARAAGHAPVTVVGFSMGGSVAIRQAAGGADRPDGLVSVSSPSRWYIRETGPMRRVHWLLENPLGGVVGRGLGIRLGVPWPVVPPSPVEMIGDVQVPILIVHGTADHYFGPEHAFVLHRAATAGGAPDAELWMEPGMSHAESAVSPDLVNRIAGWIEARVSAIAPGGVTGRAESTA